MQVWGGGNEWRRAQHRKYQRQPPPPLLNVITLQTAQPLFMLVVYKGLLICLRQSMNDVLYFSIVLNDAKLSKWRRCGMKQSVESKWAFSLFKKERKRQTSIHHFLFLSIFHINAVGSVLTSPPHHHLLNLPLFFYFIFSITFCFVFLWKSRLAFYVEGWRFVVCPRARARSPSNTQKEKHWIGWMDFFILLVTAFSFGEWPSCSLYE